MYIYLQKILPYCYFSNKLTFVSKMSKFYNFFYKCL